MWGTGPNGDVQFVNRAYRSFCGIGEGEADRSQWEQLIWPAGAPEYTAALQCAIAERTPFRAETAIRLENGQERLIGSRAEPYFSSRGEYIGHSGLSADITERLQREADRKQMEDALREAERKYRGIFDNAIVGIYQSTPEGRFLSVNPSMASMFGYSSPDEMVSLVTDIAHQLYDDPGKREEIKAGVAAQGSVQNFECEGLRKDGTRIWLTIGVRGILEDGKVVRYEGMCEDITERKLLRAQLLQAQKLESVGQLAAGIAHEINTPTQYIGDNTRFVQEAFADLKGLWNKFQNLAQAAKEHDSCRNILDDIAATTARIDAPFLLDEIPEAIDQALDGVFRIAALVGAMKEFSHPGAKEKVPLDLNHAIASTITIARNEWKYVADVETDFDESLSPVPCLPAEFNQVILNLLVNAAHAIAGVIPPQSGEKGKIKVQTRKLEDCAEIRISDTGTGIAEEIRSRVFDPFFTTKEIGKGTGQGLAIAHSVVVDKHGGTIRFETEMGEGTTFIICLPFDGGHPVPKTSTQ